MATEPLKLMELRKQQRRVAALLNKSRTDLPFHAVQRRPIPLAATFPLENWCSKLDTDGAHRNPALDFLRQGLRYAKHTCNDDPLNYDSVKSKVVTRSKRVYKNNLPKSQSVASSNDIDYVPQTGRNHGNDRQMPSVTYLCTSCREKSRDFDYDVFKTEITQSLDNNPNKSDLVLPSIFRKEATSIKTPVLRGRETMLRQNTSPIRIPIVTRSPSVVSGTGSPSKLQKRMKTFYSSVPDTSERSSDIDFESFRANLEYQHGVPPLQDDKIRALLESRQTNSRRTSGLTTGLPLTVDRLDTRGSSRWCSCGYRPSLSRARRCSECNHMGFHEISCSQYCEKDIPMCPSCGKPVRFHGNTSNLANVAGNSTRERSYIKSSTKSRLGELEKTSVSSFIKKKGSLSNNLTNDKMNPTTLAGNRVAGNEEKKVMIDGRLQTPESYLNSLEKRMKSGKYDYDVEVDINDIGKSLVISEEGRNNDDINEAQAEADDNKEEGIDWNSDVYKIAYVRALADARARSLPSDPLFLGSRTTRAFVFSYFDHLPHNCKCYKCKWGPEPGSKKKQTEIKMIFGDIDPDDYLPGARKGPKVKRKHPPTKSQEIVLPKKEKVEGEPSKAKLKFAKR